ncbi:hypothetical protein [Enterobacter sp. AG5470]|uniref:hypothetical protein n=1 Tax=Kosakonia sp. WA-90 TaxID=3153576 RepID=UPI00106878DC|nr:hypothetical protein DFO53_4078 [Enterobacter sp. AG5470]
MSQDELIFKLDKKYTPYLLKAISAVMKSEFVISGMHDISKYYISFDSKINKRANSKCYTIRFYAQEVTKDNWMDMSAGIAGGVNVDIDIKTQEIIYIYGDR